MIIVVYFIKLLCFSSCLHAINGFVFGYNYGCLRSIEERMISGIRSSTFIGVGGAKTYRQDSPGLKQMTAKLGEGLSAYIDNYIY